LSGRKIASDMPTDACPICAAPRHANARYPRHVCNDCTSRASSSDGRPVVFRNTDTGDRVEAWYRDSDERYATRECFISGVRCEAEEARFGGIVIQVVG
jgi:hypothetical protein